MYNFGFVYIAQINFQYKRKRKNKLQYKIYQPKVNKIGSKFQKKKRSNE